MAAMLDAVRALLLIAGGLVFLFLAATVAYLLPWWVLLPALPAVVAVGHFRYRAQHDRERRARRQAEGLCVACGYDLAGNVSGVCPECGSAE